MRPRNATPGPVAPASRGKGGAIRQSTVVIALALAAVAATAGAALATHSGGKGPKKDFATGTATRTAVVSGSDTRVMMGVSARSGPSGENARGRFFVKRKTEPAVQGRPDLDFSGRVTCLRVTGNRAIVGGVVTRDKLDLPSNQIEGTGFLGIYVDNDQVNGRPDDQSNSSPGFAAPGNTCPERVFLPGTQVELPTAPFQQGNYVVHDASPSVERRGRSRKK